MAHIVSTTASKYILQIEIFGSLIWTGTRTLSFYNQKNPISQINWLLSSRNYNIRRFRVLGDEYEELSSSLSRNLFLGGVTSCSVSLELGILRGEEENWRVRGISMGAGIVVNRSTKPINNRKLLLHTLGQV